MSVENLNSFMGPGQPGGPFGHTAIAGELPPELRPQQQVPQQQAPAHTPRPAAEKLDRRSIVLQRIEKAMTKKEHRKTYPLNPIGRLALRRQYREALGPDVSKRQIKRAIRHDRNHEDVLTHSGIIGRGYSRFSHAIRRDPDHKDGLSHAGIISGRSYYQRRVLGAAAALASGVWLYGSYSSGEAVGPPAVFDGLRMVTAEVAAESVARFVAPGSVSVDVQPIIESPVYSGGPAPDMQTEPSGPTAPNNENAFTQAPQN